MFKPSGGSEDFVCVKSVIFIIFLHSIKHTKGIIKCHQVINFPSSLTSIK
jgi:hypothetical protein